jgi:hypothetical protein
MVANKVPSMDQNIQSKRMLIDTFQRCAELRQNINGQARTFHGSQPTDGEPFDGDNNVGDDFGLESMDLNHDDDYDETMSNMFREVQTPLYEGYPTSRLATILLFLNLCKTHGVNNMFVDEFFSLLRLDLFLRDNTPKSLYEAKTIVKWLGLSYNSIHACYNGCVLFRGELKGATSFPKYKRSRFVEGSNTIPCKVLRYFPLIPRLKWMYRCPTLVDLMT